MAPTIYWPTDHSPITHTDPPNPPNQTNWFWTLGCSTPYKPYNFWNLLAPTIHRPITHTDSPLPSRAHRIWTDILWKLATSTSIYTSSCISSSYMGLGSHSCTRSSCARQCFEGECYLKIFVPGIRHICKFRRTMTGTISWRGASYHVEILHRIMRIVIMLV